MTPTERALYLRIQRRAGSMSPEMSAAILKAFQRIRASFTDAQLQRLVASGGAERLIQQALGEAMLNRAYAPVRERVRSAVVDNARYFSRDVPKPARIDFVFNMLNPRVIDGITRLETRVMTTLSDAVRETVRAHIENGLRDGVNPREVARGIRGIIGLAPNQEEAVRNWRRALEGAEGARSPFAYKLRDKRFDASVRKGGLAPAQIEKMVDAYRRKMLAFHAETVSRTATLDALKLGQRLSWEDAVEQGIIDRNRLTRTWVGVMDERERDSHVAMEGETVAFDEPYSNGQIQPGSGEFNCRCIERFSQRRAA